MNQQIIRGIAAGVVGLLWTEQCLARTPLNVRSRDILAPVAGQFGVQNLVDTLKHA